jgi:hypothetical protein
VRKTNIKKSSKKKSTRQFGIYQRADTLKTDNVRKTNIKNPASRKYGLRPLRKIFKILQVENMAEGQ